MKQEYKVRLFQNNTYNVIKIVTTYGRRISAYDSDPHTIEENIVYQGTLADCYVYIRLHEGDYMYL